MRKEIKQLHQRLHTTTLFVTHDQVEAMTMADKIVVMNAGLIEQIGSPLELYDRPNNVFVATFIGSPSMNLLKGTYNTRSNSFVSEHGDAQRLAVRPNATDGQIITLGIRPEHIDISNSGLEATITVVEPTGAETVAFLNYGDAEIVALLRERLELGVGETVKLKLNKEKLHVFDSVNGLRL
jgi:multiple sugar transport system ATP-binding protein